MMSTISALAPLIKSVRQLSMSPSRRSLRGVIAWIRFGPKSPCVTLCANARASENTSI